MLTLIKRLMGVDSQHEADAILRVIEQPEWDASDLHPSWEDYIPEVVRREWPQLSLETRLAVYMVAKCANETSDAFRNKA